MRSVLFSTALTWGQLWSLGFTAPVFATGATDGQRPPATDGAKKILLEKNMRKVSRHTVSDERQEPILWPADFEDAPFPVASAPSAQAGAFSSNESARSAADAATLAQVRAEAWKLARFTRKLGPHHTPPKANTFSAAMELLSRAASPAEWYVLTLLLLMLLLIDVSLLQTLPDHARMHVALLVFWLLVSCCVGAETWLREGPAGGVSWVMGYVFELLFCLDNVFVFHLIFESMDTPARLLSKVMFVGLLGALVFRFSLLLGVAGLMNGLQILPYLLGAWLIYCGVGQVAARRDDEDADVTQASAVRIARNILGERLGEFYDEEDEAVITTFKDKYRVTLLGVVIFCVLACELLFSFDVVLSKADLVPNVYLNLSSSIMALFTIRALFFVARDLFGRFHTAHYGVGLVLIFLGGEMLLARAVFVSALSSGLAMLGIMVVAAGASPCLPKEADPKLLV